MLECQCLKWNESIITMKFNEFSVSSFIKWHLVWLYCFHKMFKHSPTVHLPAQKNLKYSNLAALIQTQTSQSTIQLQRFPLTLWTQQQFLAKAKWRIYYPTPTIHNVKKLNSFTFSDLLSLNTRNKWTCVLWTRWAVCQTQPGHFCLK